MKIIHIESGLGNQMLAYCEYLAIKQSNPSDKCFIENVIFDIPQCNDIICQWNGYELERIFGIEEPNIKECFTYDEWNKFKQEVVKSKFWQKNWNYPVAITNALEIVGIKVKNLSGDFSLNYNREIYNENKFTKYLKYYIKRIIKNKVFSAYYEKQKSKQLNLFIKSEDDIYIGQTLGFRFKGTGIENINVDLNKIFTFPKLKDEKNIEYLKYIRKVNSVAIHARRGDFLSINGDCYKYGFFKRSVKYIKKQVKNPVFIFFCDTESIEWCKDNLNIFGLDDKKDEIRFVDWNTGEDSYIDMQLMSNCKHNIITNSTFGWWGAYLNQNPNKITCSPDITINTTHTF